MRRGEGGKGEARGTRSCLCRRAGEDGGADKVARLVEREPALGQRRQRLSQEVSMEQCCRDTHEEEGLAPWWRREVALERMVAAAVTCMGSRLESTVNLVVVLSLDISPRICVVSKRKIQSVQLVMRNSFLSTPYVPVDVAPLFCEFLL